MSVSFEDRADKLLTILKDEGELRTADVASRLQVSEMSIRRDLGELESRGLLRRVWGGARPAHGAPFSTRNVIFSEEKTQVAKKALPLVPRTGVIAIDSSTTMARLAQQLTEAENLTVVTNSLITFQSLQDRPGIVPIITGGMFDHLSDSLVGHDCERTIRGFSFDIYFASTARYEPLRGGFESTSDEAAVKMAFIDSSQQVVLGINSQKLSDDAGFSSFRNSNIDLLISELEPEFWDDKDLPTNIRTR